MKNLTKKMFSIIIYCADIFKYFQYKTMIFRPSDDVLDQNWQVIPQTNEFVNQSNSNDSEHQLFHAEDGSWNPSVPNLNPDNIVIPDVDTEEVKAPDLSDLLTKDNTSATSENASEPTDNLKNEDIIENNQSSENMVDENENQNANIVDNQVLVNNANEQASATENLTPTNETSNETNNETNNDTQNNTPTWNSDIEEAIPWKMTDEERIKLVSNIEWAIHSNLDLLVNEQWYKTIIKYRKIHRIVFKRWLFIFSAFIWVLIWTLFQVNAWQSNSYQMIKDESIEDISSWRVSDMPDKILEDIKGKGIDVIVPYWSAKLDGKSFQSKGNLISYNWIILPQVASLNYETNKFSIDDFDQKKMNRSDLEELLKMLVNDSVVRKTKDLKNPFDMKRKGQEFEWWLESFFNLKCLDATKLSDFVCDDFLEIFNKYGKYYDLSSHSSELVAYVENLKKYKKDIKPVCEMIKEYSIHAWTLYSSDFDSIMNDCGPEYRHYYKKMTNFIEVENSMSQPELSEKVYDDPDINAYKLISSWQSVYKFLNGTVNKNYIISYLKFVEKLIWQDKGTNKYISPIYKDLLYIFNTDEVYTKLLNKWELSADIKNLIDKINNWNWLDGYPLVNLVTTQDVVNAEKETDYTETKQLTLEEMFSQYYYMTDKLKIRKVDEVSDDEIRVQSEIISNAVKSKVWDEQWGSLKATVSLKRKDNILYVSNIKIANQQKLTDILNIHATQEDVTLNAMLVYIDEQVGFWYDNKAQEVEDKPTFCDTLSGKVEIKLRSCDDSSIILNKWDIEYKFIINNWILDSFEISDEELNSMVKDSLASTMIMKDNTTAIIESVIEFNKDEPEETNIDKKMQVIDQFRLYFKIIPEIESMDWDTFLLNFTLWEFDLQAYYDINTQILSKISYVACDKTLEIKDLTIEVSSNNATQLTEILNNPRIFFTKANQTAYKKYQKMCE